MRDLDDPPLKGAELYVKMVHAKQNGKDTELFGFSIPFDKYLAQEKVKKDSAKDPKAMVVDTSGDRK